VAEREQDEYDKALDAIKKTGKSLESLTDLVNRHSGDDKLQRKLKDQAKGCAWRAGRGCGAGSTRVSRATGSPLPPMAWVRSPRRSPPLALFTLVHRVSWVAQHRSHGGGQMATRVTRTEGDNP